MKYYQQVAHFWQLEISNYSEYYQRTCLKV